MVIIDSLIVINNQDNVGNAITDINPNEKAKYTHESQQFEVHCNEKIAFGFKLALKKIKKGSDIIKYGVVIGKASIDIPEGNLVHIHNMEGHRGRGDL